MVVDPRHDHGFRIPRPDLSAKLGLPNACNACHADRSAEWAAATVEGWNGPRGRGFQNYAEAFHAAWANQANAGASPRSHPRPTPAFARASALGQRVSPANIDVARKGLADPDPLVRIGALDMLEAVPAAQAWQLVSPLLSDPVGGVRIRAALVARRRSTRQPAARRPRALRVRRPNS